MKRSVLVLASLVVMVPIREAVAAVINVAPSDGPMAYTKIEGANPGDEVILAPGTYAFRVYLQQQASAASPIYIHSADPSNPAIVDLSSAPGGLVDNAPGSYTAGDRARGCWQLSGATNIHIDGIVFQNCHASDNDSAAIRYYNGTTGFLLTNVLIQGNDNGLTGGTVSGDGTTQSDATVEFSEFSRNGNLAASSSSPTHNIYIYGGNFTLRYSYLHDPVQAQNLHCRAINSTIEYNWFTRAKSYVGDLMTNDDYANNPVGSLTQSMTFRGNLVFQGSGQANDSQILAVYNDEASGSPVTFQITMLYNTLVGAGGHAAFVHLSNADGTTMSAELDDNIVSGTSVATLVEDMTHATVTGKNNWLMTGTPTNGVTGSVFGTDPSFANAGSLDFVPLAASAAVGAADDTVSGLPVDEYYENDTVTRMYRARATAKDIGAFEHTTTGPGIGPYGADGGSVVTLGDAGTGAGNDSGGPSGGDSGTSTHGDAGGSARDAGGGHASDGGARGADAGRGAGDAGRGSSADAAPGGSPRSGGGCSCEVANVVGDTGGFAWALGFVGWALRRRRPSRRVG
jgi:hypothetical protein